MPYPENVYYTTHAIERMHARFIRKQVVEDALMNGEVVEEYNTSEEARYRIHWESPRSDEDSNVPQALRTFHVIAADQAGGRTVVITAYRPGLEPERWDDDLKRRAD